MEIGHCSSNDHYLLYLSTYIYRIGSYTMPTVYALRSNCKANSNAWGFPIKLFYCRPAMLYSKEMELSNCLFMCWRQIVSIIGKKQKMSPNTMNINLFLYIFCLWKLVFIADVFWSAIYLSGELLQQYKNS